MLAPTHGLRERPEPPSWPARGLQRFQPAEYAGDRGRLGQDALCAAGLALAARSVRSARGARSARSARGARGARRALMDGKAVAAKVREEVKERVRRFQDRTGTSPGLAVVLVGDRPDSQSYVRAKTKVGEEVGCHIRNVQLPESVSQEELLAKVGELNADASVHGILVQLPLPKGIDEVRVLDSILPAKDADGLTAASLGQLARPGGAGPVALPCTPAGCMELLRSYEVELAGKNCVVLGRSAIVGMPMMLLLQRANATVTLCHRRTKDLVIRCAEAEVLVAAVGRPNFVQAEWVRSGAVVLDVGINRVEDATRPRGYRLCGDVALGVQEVAALISPVPGGVGPMTVAMLLRNTITLAEASCPCRNG
ncbi:unnamed protein product [Effrenium voratum]|nr:unnamed protein product [Effrenium voratum]